MINESKKILAEVTNILYNEMKKMKYDDNFDLSLYKTICKLECERNNKNKYFEFKNAIKYFKKYHFRTSGKWIKYNPINKDKSNDYILWDYIRLIGENANINDYKFEYIQHGKIYEFDILKSYKNEYTFKIINDLHKDDVFKIDNQIYINVNAGFLHKNKTKKYSEYSDEVKLNVKRCLFHIYKVWCGQIDKETDNTIYNKNYDSDDEIEKEIREFDEFGIFKENSKYSNNKQFKYVLLWLVHACLGHKREVALLMMSGEGTGKSIIMNFLVNNVIGRNLGYITSKMNNLQRFNGAILGKILVVAEEMPKQDKSGWSTLSDIIKDLITNHWMDIEFKYEEVKTVVNNTSLCILTNNKNPLNLSGEARRWHITDISHDFVGNREYFQKLGKALGSPDTVYKLSEHDELTGEAVFELFKEIFEIDQASNNRFNEKIIPRTKAKIQMKCELIEAFENFFKEEYVKKKEDLIKGTKMNELMAEYLNSRHNKYGINLKTKNTFKNKLLNGTIPLLKFEQRGHNAISLKQTVSYNELHKHFENKELWDDDFDEFEDGEKPIVLPDKKFGDNYRLENDTLIMDKNLLKENEKQKQLIEEQACLLKEITERLMKEHIKLPKELLNQLDNILNNKKIDVIIENIPDEKPKIEEQQTLKNVLNENDKNDEILTIEDEPKNEKLKEEKQPLTSNRYKSRNKNNEKIQILIQQKPIEDMKFKDDKNDMLDKLLLNLEKTKIIPKNEFFNKKHDYKIENEEESEKPPKKKQLQKQIESDDEIEESDEECEKPKKKHNYKIDSDSDNESEESEKPKKTTPKKKQLKKQIESDDESEESEEKSDESEESESEEESEKPKKKTTPKKTPPKQSPPKKTPQKRQPRQPKKTQEISTKKVGIETEKIECPY